MLELQWQDNSFYATICLTNKRELGKGRSVDVGGRKKRWTDNSFDLFGPTFTVPLPFLPLPRSWRPREREKSTPRELASTLAFCWKQEGRTLKEDAGQNILEVQTLILQCLFRAKFLWKVPVSTTLPQTRKGVRSHSGLEAEDMSCSLELLDRITQEVLTWAVPPKQHAHLTEMLWSLS